MIKKQIREQNYEENVSSISKKKIKSNLQLNCSSESNYEIRNSNLNTWLIQIDKNRHTDPI